MSLGSITEKLLQSFDGVIISFIFHILWSLFFLFRFYLFDTENKNRGSSKQREREKQAPHWEGSPTWSSIPGPQYHNLSWRQTPNQFSHSGTPCSLKFCIAVFTFEEAVTSSSLKYLPSALVGILKLSQTFYGYTCSLLLAPSCVAEFLSLYEFSWSCNITGHDMLTATDCFFQGWHGSSNLRSLPCPESG